MSTPRDCTVNATRKRLLELSYSLTSADDPERRPLYGKYRRSLSELGEHTAAIQCYPTSTNAGVDDLDNLDKRQVVLLIVTGYLLSDAKQSKAVFDALSKHGVTNGPYFLNGFGDRHYPLQWNDAEPIYDEQFQTRLAFASDDRAVLLRQGIAPIYIYGRSQWGFPLVGTQHEAGTHIFSIDAEWKQGHILDTPRHRLPELLRANARDLIEDVELARWGARPAAKDAA